MKEWTIVTESTKIPIMTWITSSCSKDEQKLQNPEALNDLKLLSQLPSYTKAEIFVM